LRTMRSLIPVLAAAMVPFAVIILIVVGSGVGLVQWRPPQNWAVDFGTSNSDNGVTAITSDATGFYATGYVGYTGSPSINVTPSQLYLTRYDLSGHQVWSATFGSPVLSQINALSIGQDAVFIAGTVFRNSSFVEKYDLSGNEVWSRLFGSGVTGAVAISVATAGVYIGYYQGAKSFLREYDLSGNVLWTDLLGNYTGGLSVYASSTGPYVLDPETPNTLVRRYDTNGLVVWTQTCSCGAQHFNGISGDSSGIYVLGLAQNQVSANIAKYDLNGNVIWTSHFGAPDHTNVVDFQVSAGSSGVYLTMTTGGHRSFLMKYDVGGNIVWSFDVHTLESLLSPGIAVSVNGNSVFVGGSVEKSDGTLDAYAAEFGQSSSLIFFGINPPWSFIIVGALVTVAGLGIWFFRKRYLRRLALRPKSASPNPHLPRD